MVGPPGPVRLPPSVPTSASAAPVLRPSAPTPVVRVGPVAARWTRAGAPDLSERQVPERGAARLAAAVGGRALLARAPLARATDAPPPHDAAARGAGSYGAAAYAAADALRARPRDETIEVSVRPLADGGRP